MERILISACLVGDNVKYNGGNNKSPLIDQLLEKYELIPFCPEVEGGLPIPRIPSEIKGSQVINKEGKNVTRQFEKGANKALALCKYLGITKAVLKENSPSCGTHMIHNGHFMDRLIPGMGVTARILKEHNIEVFSEKEIDKLL